MIRGVISYGSATDPLRVGHWSATGLLILERHQPRRYIGQLGRTHFVAHAGIAFKRQRHVPGT